MKFSLLKSPLQTNSDKALRNVIEFNYVIAYTARDRIIAYPMIFSVSQSGQTNFKAACSETKEENTHDYKPNFTLQDEN